MTQHTVVIERCKPPFLLADNHIQLASTLGLGPVQQADIDLVGDMPSGRKPFSIAGAAEPGTFSQAERERRELCRLAEWYFDDRDHFVREYLDEAVILGKDRVLVHAPMREISPRTVFPLLAKGGLGFPEVFAKLVRAREAELREPYAL